MCMKTEQDIAAMAEDKAFDELAQRNKRLIEERKKILLYKPVAQGVKHDSHKLRMSLIPNGTLAEVVKVLEFGAEKYSPDNWKHVDDARTRYFDAAQRHIMTWWDNDNQTDPESGRHHLAHAICCLLFLMWFDLVGKHNDKLP